jgi:copper transport protein
VAGALVAALFSVGPAVAHSFVRSTQPKANTTTEEPPDQVVIRFDEPVELAFGGIEVLGPEGARVDTGETEYVSEDETTIAVGLVADLADGRYVVEWRIVAADGHPRNGKFGFRLALPPSATPTPAETPGATPTESPMGGAGSGGPPTASEGAGSLPALLLRIDRWILFASLIILVGFGVFGHGVWRSSGSIPRPPEVEETFWRRWRPGVSWALVAAVASSLASLPLEGAIAADVSLRDALSGEVLGTLLTTRFGVVTLIRLGLLVAGAALVFGVRRPVARPVVAAAGVRRSLGAAAAVTPVPWGTLSLWAILGVALFATVSAAGHAGTSDPLVVGMASDMVHLAAGAVWIGGLVALMAVALPSTKNEDDRERVEILAPVVTRFSTVAVLCVAVIAATGALRGWMEIRTWEGLTGETYGLALLTKLAVIVPLLALGLFNNRWSKPRIQRAAGDAGLTTSGAAALRTLRRVVIAEVLLAAVVLAVTAVLVDQAPPVGGPEMHGG